MSKIDKRFKPILLIITTLLFAASCSINAVDSVSIEGYLICVEPDGKGDIHIKAEFSDCSGNVALINLQDRIYTISGPQSSIDKLLNAPKRRMGVLMDQTLTGKLYGHKRAQHFMIGDEKYVYDNKTEKKKGTIYCLFPDYKKTYMNYKIAKKPCFNYSPHAHVLYTNDGQILAINGNTEHIKHVEASTERKGVDLTGSISGSKNGKYIYLQ